MQKVLSSLVWGIMICCIVTDVAEVQGAGQPDKAEKASNEVKTRPSAEKMMPAPEIQLQRMSKGLQLTEEQQKQIQPILDDEFVRLKEIRQSVDNSPAQIQKKVEALRSATISKIKVYMTQEQQEKFTEISDKIKSSKQQRMMENRKARIGTQPDQSERPVQ